MSAYAGCSKNLKDLKKVEQWGLLAGKHDAETVLWRYNPMRNDRSDFTHSRPDIGLRVRVKSLRSSYTGSNPQMCGATHTGR